MNRRAPRRTSPGQEVARATESDEYRSAHRPLDPVADAGLEPVEDLLDDDPLGDEAMPEDGGANGTVPAELRIHAVTPAEYGQRLDRALAAWVPEHSRSHLQSLIEAGLVQIDGLAASNASRRLLLGQTVRIELRLPPSQQRFAPELMALDVRYQDDHLLILDKPAGLVVHPAAGNWQGTLLNGLLAHDLRLADLPRAGIVHRLDKDTSGLMVVARSVAAMTGLVRAIAAREVARTYLAIAWGAVPASVGRIEQPIGRDLRSRVRMAVRAGGKPARTDVVCLATRAVSGPPGAPEACVFSALQCKLHTGRTHQIRVHLAQVGHPLVADPVYGGRPALGLDRQALHAVSLGLVHPVTREPIQVAAAPPGDFAAAWQRVSGSVWVPPAQNG
jgi:23S rRNA pseudouridine1911/1915/1917 synthase